MVMNLQDLKIGMKVRISMGDCNATRRTCSLTSSMKRMRGKISKIRQIYPDDMVLLDNGWTWNPKDLRKIKEISKKEPPKIQFFDEQRLWIC
jgi:hypothetical protein